MKKEVLLCIIVGVLASFSASGQFHIETGLSLNIPSGDFGKVYELGVGIYLEPKYALTERVDLGVYVGSHAFPYPEVAGVSLDGISLIPILVTGTYRFTTESITAYAGIGMGLFYDASTTFYAEDPVTGQTISVKEEGVSEFGLAPRAGVYIGRINVGLTYNSVPDFNFIQMNLGVRILNRG